MGWGGHERQLPWVLTRMVPLQFHRCVMLPHHIFIWIGWGGGGAMTSVALRAQPGATLQYVIGSSLALLHTLDATSKGSFSCTRTNTGCYVIESSLAENFCRSTCA